MAQVQTRQQSVDPEQRSRLLQLSWNQLERPGAYVEVGSGDLYRIPKEALLKGGSPLIHKESSGTSTLVQISDNPYITTFQARMVCAEHNMPPRSRRLFHLLRCDPYWCRGSSASRRPSPSRLNESTSRKIETPGQIAIQGAWST